MFYLRNAGVCCAAVFFPRLFNFPQVSTYVLVEVYFMCLFLELWWGELCMNLWPVSQRHTLTMI